MNKGLLIGMQLILSGVLATGYANTEQPVVTHAYKMSKVQDSLHHIVASKQRQLTNTNKPIVVKWHHRVVRVTLSSNRTTGYSWFLSKLNHHLIKPISAVFAPPVNTKLMGAPGTVTWTFKIKKAAFRVPRIMKIELLYARPWDLASAEPKVITLVTTGHF